MVQLTLDFKPMNMGLQKLKHKPSLDVGLLEQTTPVSPRKLNNNNNNTVLKNALYISLNAFT